MKLDDVKGWGELNGLNPEEFKRQVFNYAAILGVMELDSRKAGGTEAIKFTTQIEGQEVELYVRYSGVGRNEIPIPAGWKISLNPKPIPLRDFDYDFWHDDYDGADGGNGLCGAASSIAEAVNQIKQIMEGS
tara:strand:- start:11 stop:406 length:396 start_codon:yes stop_codon:yes gene_type:complete